MPDIHCAPIPIPLLLSAQDMSRLKHRARRWAYWLSSHPDTPWRDVWRAAARQPHLPYRVALHVDGIPQAIEALEALASGRGHPAVTAGHARLRAGLVYVFAGHGAYSPGMGRALMEAVPAVTEAVTLCDEVIYEVAGWSVAQALRGEPLPHSPHPFVVNQCGSFALAIGLAAACSQWAPPDAVVGHSVGELIAAVVSGAISPRAGARVAVSSAEVVAESQPGGMLFIKRPSDEVEALIEPIDGLSVAVIDSPGSVVVSGGLAPLEVLERRLIADGAFCRRVDVANAPHSPHMDAILPRLRASLSFVAPTQGRLPMMSSTTGRWLSGAELSADYWCINTRSPVRFDRAMRGLIAAGYDTFVELGGHPLLTTGMSALANADGAASVAVFGSLRRGRTEPGALTRMLSELHVSGQPIDWPRLTGEGPLAPLPRPSEAVVSPATDSTRAPTNVAPDAPIGATLPIGANPPTDLRGLERLLRDALASVLDTETAQAVDAEAPLDGEGLDSLQVFELKNQIARRCGLRLPQHFLYDHPSLAAAARALAGRLGLRPSASTGGGRPRLATVLAAEPDCERRLALVLPPLRAQIERATGQTELDVHRPLSEMGLDDVLGAEVCLRLQREAGLRVFPREIVELPTVYALATRLAEQCGPYRTPESSSPLDALDARVASPYGVWTDDEPEPPSEQELVFVLSPPRSGSTLLRVMLAGHPALFSPQELHLGPFATMADYDAALRGTVLDMGLVSAVAEVISRAGAWNLCRGWVREARPTTDIYAFFGARIGDRRLVDKSPLFFPPLDVLRRLAGTFPRARFVHLVRHPISCIGSYVAERFQGIFEQTADLDPYDAAEWCWTRVHEGIETFAAELPAERITRVYFEDLAVDPERVMRRLCPALGLRFEPAVLEPYSGHRMVAGGFQVGDPNFTRHRRIVADKAETWRSVELPRPLQAQTLTLARRLGYDMTPSSPSADPATPAGPARSGGAASNEAMGGIGMEDHAHLPADITPHTPYAAPDARPTTVLLTGATGFLGAFLLDELLRQTSAVVYCLVRARDLEHARTRLRDNLEHYGLDWASRAHRVAPIVGDLTSAELGLSDAAHAALRSVEAIYHCAARVSWLLPYCRLRAANVDGLIRVLRLSCQLGTVPVHYVSSLGTAFVRPFEDDAMVEWATQASGLGTESILELPLGYLESKWVNARIIAEARRRGVPVSLYAPGLVGGHSVTGVDSLSESQFLHALIKGSTQLGGFPDAHGWRFIPVDEAARRIVACSVVPQVRDVDVYLDSTALIDPGDMIDVLRAEGYDVRLLPFAVWRQRVLDLAERHATGNALFTFTDVVYSFTPLRFIGQRLQMDYFLQNRDIPPELHPIVSEQAYIDRDLLERLVQYYVRVGSMPPRPSAD